MAGDTGDTVEGTRADRRDLSAFSLWWASFKAIRGLIVSALSVGISIILKKFVDVAVPLWIVALVAAATILVIVALCDALMTAVLLARTPRTITVLDCTEATGPYAGSHALIILRAPDGLPPDATLTFYRMKGVVQEHIGFGSVQHQQDSETFQVTLDRLYDGIDVASLLDKNATKVADISARIEFSASKADQTRAPVTKTGIARTPNAANGNLDTALPNPALPEATPSTPEVKK